MRLTPPVRNASAPPYLASPTIGWPIAAMCARSWCVRPVRGCSSTHAARLPAWSITRQLVFAGSPYSSLDMHFSPPVPGCLASGASISALAAVGIADDDCPIDLPRGASGEGFGEMPGGACGPRDQQRARRILVEPMDQLGPPALVRQPVEQPVEMLVVLVPPCVARPGGLLSTNASGPRRSPSRARTVLLRASAVRARLRPAAGPARFRRRQTDFLPSLEPVAGHRPFAVDRNWPVRAQRETMLKLTSGKCRLNQRSRRMPSSSSSTVKVRTSLTAGRY